MWFYIWGHVDGWITLLFLALWHRTKHWTIADLQFPACVYSYVQGKLVSWVYLELKLAELFVSSEPYTDTFWTIFVFEGFFFHGISTPLPPSHYFEQFFRGRYSCWPPAQPSKAMIEGWQQTFTSVLHVCAWLHEMSSQPLILANRVGCHLSLPVENILVISGIGSPFWMILKV